jgi:Spy/CpxP family protein refolding chaperone
MKERRLKMKKFIGATWILVLAAFIAFPVMAAAQGSGTGKNTGKMVGMERGKGRMGNMGDKTSSLTTDQQQQIEKLQKKFRDDNADTLKQLMTKRFDLNTILDSDKPDADKAKAIQKEISDLDAKLAQKRIDLYIELSKIAPDAKFGRGLGKGMGMRGMGVGNES